MTTCTYCPAPATTTGPLGEPPLCWTCACEDDGTDEWHAEEYARQNLLTNNGTPHYLQFNDGWFEVAYYNDRWTAVDISKYDIPSWGRIIEVTE